MHASTHSWVLMLQIILNWKDCVDKTNEKRCKSLLVWDLAPKQKLLELEDWIKEWNWKWDVKLEKKKRGKNFRLSEQNAKQKGCARDENDVTRDFNEAWAEPKADVRRQTLLFYWLTDTHGGKTGPRGKGVWKRSTKPGIKWYMYMLWQLRWFCKVSLGAYAYTVSPSRKQGYLKQLNV